MEFCQEHSEVKSLIKRNTYDISEQEKKIDRNDRQINERIDGMKNWVVAGMSSLVIQLMIFIFGIIFYFVKGGI